MYFPCPPTTDPSTGLSKCQHKIKFLCVQRQACNQTLERIALYLTFCPVVSLIQVCDRRGELLRIYSRLGRHLLTSEDCAAVDILEDKDWMRAGRKRNLGGYFHRGGPILVDSRNCSLDTILYFFVVSRVAYLSREQREILNLGFGVCSSTLVGSRLGFLK